MAEADEVNEEPSSNGNGTSPVTPEIFTGPPNRGRSTSRSRAKAIAIARNRWAQGLHQPFVFALNRFQGAMAALRESHGSISDMMQDWPNERVTRLKQVILDASPEQRKGLDALLEEVLPGLFTGSIYITLSKTKDPELPESSGVSSVTLPAWEKVLEVLDGDAGLAHEFLTAAYDVQVAPSQAELVRSSLLMSAVAALEALISALVHEFYTLNPGALRNSGSFNLQDLETIGTVADARRKTIEDKADSILKGGLSSWEDWLAIDELKITLKNHCHSYPTLVEIFQRRHVQVHHGGTVSRDYQRKLQDVAGIMDPPDVGTYLPVTQEYLDEALDEIEAVGNLLGGSVWVKCRPKEEESAIYQLYTRTYDLMLDGHWVPVKVICATIKLRGEDEDMRLISKVNELIARKSLGEDISGELEAWSVATLHARFQMAKAALEDNFEEADRQMRKCIKSEDLDLEDAQEWPLFAQFRDSEFWVKFVQDHPPA